jgi:hypothetical protein
VVHGCFTLLSEVILKREELCFLGTVLACRGPSRHGQRSPAMERYRIVCLMRISRLFGSGAPSVMFPEGWYAAQSTQIVQSPGRLLARDTSLELRKSSSRFYVLCEGTIGYRQMH